MSPTLWLISPVFFDCEAYRLVRERVLEVLNDHPQPYFGRVAFAVIDDSGGADPEVSSLRSLGDVSVIQPPFNLGHQRALVYGVRSMLGRVEEEDVIVTLDADGEDRPEDLPRLLAPVLADGDGPQTVSLALRTKRRESPSFRLFYFLFRTGFRWLTGETVRSGNYAAYKGALARRMLLHPYFDLCYSATLISISIPVSYVPCERGNRYAGRSRMTFSRLAMHGVRMLMPFTDRIAIRALIAFSASFAAGLLLSLVILGIRYFSDAAIPGWATSTLLLVMIVSLISLGNFVVLFAVFSQSRGISLHNLEEVANERSRSAPRPPD